MTSEAEVVAMVRLELSRRNVTLWVNACGTADEGNRKVSYGLCRGSSDLIGIHAPTGRFVAVECKSPVGMIKHRNAISRLKDKTNPITREEKHALEQHLFVSLVLSKGGIAGFVYDEQSLKELCCSLHNVT